jgi:CRISPR-associated protein Cas5d
MEYTDKEYCLEVCGDFACFTRPEMKVERVSYDVITPSAARAIFESIFWKPAIRWEVSKIEVLNPIKWSSIKRNEVGAIGTLKTKCIIANDKRQQKNSLILKDVRYRIHAKLIFIPLRDRKGEQKREPGPDENPGKYQAEFERRAGKGQCFNQPYLGTREFSASYRLVGSSDESQSKPIDETKDLGIMLYDMDFSDKNNIMPMFFRAHMEHGVINVPSFKSEEILR